MRDEKLISHSLLQSQEKISQISLLVFNSQSKYTLNGETLVEYINM